MIFHFLFSLFSWNFTDKGLDDDPDDVYHPPPRKRRQRKRGGGDPDLPPSQWSVLSLTEFLNYNCPACDFKCKDQAKFLEHAYETHVDSVKYLCSGMTTRSFLALMTQELVFFNSIENSRNLSE